MYSTEDTCQLFYIYYHPLEMVDAAKQNSRNVEFFVAIKGYRNWKIKK